MGMLCLDATNLHHQLCRSLPSNGSLAKYGKKWIFPNFFLSLGCCRTIFEVKIMQNFVPKLKKFQPKYIIMGAHLIKYIDVTYLIYKMFWLEQVLCLVSIWTSYGLQFQAQSYIASRKHLFLKHPIPRP